MTEIIFNVLKFAVTLMPKETLKDVQFHTPVPEEPKRNNLMKKSNELIELAEKEEQSNDN